MKSYRKELWFNIPGRRAFVNITPQVVECLRESNIQEGICLVNAMHITASVFINDDESGLHHDYEVWLERLAPHAPIDQAGPEAGCTTGRVRTPVQDKGQGLAEGKLGRCAPEAERNSQCCA
jgi:hypothetical protein